VKPGVSVIVPCFNERYTIRSLLQAIHDQTYPLTDLEVIIADGLSTDGTREAIRTFASEHPELDIRLINNQDRIIPAALNRAIEVARGEVIIRLDAHSIPRPNYVERCLMSLEKTGAANVGGIWEIKPGKDGWLPRSIAVAASHRLGAGDARYRTGGNIGEVDTVPFGAFKRGWMERVGFFDETLLTNEDYEYNYRIRQAGGVIWFDPEIRSIYFARPDLPSLAKQYARYGYWKAHMLLRFPGSLRLRQVLPPLFVLAGLILGLITPFWHQARFLLGVQLAGYILITILAGVWSALRMRDLGLLFGFPLAIWTIHFAWGGAFLWCLLTNILGGRRESSKT
jgi:glycosyltransferase involved in cell wall biosynthesis